jgi:hypothetical protein
LRGDFAGVAQVGLWRGICRDLDAGLAGLPVPISPALPSVFSAKSRLSQENHLIVTQFSTRRLLNLSAFISTIAVRHITLTALFMGLSYVWPLWHRPHA